MAQILVYVRCCQFLGVIGVLFLFAGFDSCAQADEVSFGRQVRPILSASCFHCHGPDEESREADLRLDTREGLFGDLGDYRAVVPNAPEQSELFRRISSTDPDEHMPPADREHQLTEEDIALIKRWIEQGATWQQHWSLTTPSRPELPKIARLDWAETPIDHFVLARLEAEKLSPTEEADRQTLIRRVTIDLTGLPATKEEADDFLADTSSSVCEVPSEICARLIPS